jgi:hypothetical protein
MQLGHPAIKLHSASQCAKRIGRTDTAYKVEPEMIFAGGGGNDHDLGPPCLS